MGEDCSDPCCRYLYRWVALFSGKGGYIHEVFHLHVQSGYRCVSRLLLIQMARQACMITLPILRIGDGVSVLLAM